MTLAPLRNQAAVSTRPTPRISACYPAPAPRNTSPLLAPDVSAFTERATRNLVQLNPELATVQLGAKQVRAMLIASGQISAR